MFKRYEIPCHRDDFHISHEYFGGWVHFFDTVICPGKLRKHEPKPDVSDDQPEAVTWEIKDHKHSLRLNGWGYSNKDGILGLDTRLTFQCKDRGCLYEVTVMRHDYNELVIDYSKLDQTWPG